ncbi:MAG: hypothetical protein ACE5GO_06860 [Anaerolineales bacterium]
MNDTAITVSTRVAQHFAALPFNTNVDGKLRVLLESEYHRRLSHYRLIDHNLQKNMG